jgi:hypothetical protein
MRESGVIYTGDPVDKLPRLGASVKKLMSDRKVETVQQFAAFLRMRQDCRRNIVKQIKGLSMEGLLLAEAAAERAQPGPPEPKVNRKSNNPYLSRFGKDKWYAEVLKQPPAMKAVTNVRHLVEYIMKVSREEHFAGTKYEDDWYFYHDALLLMTATETVEWMKSRGYYKHWILPQHDLNSQVSYYQKVKPIGNNPGAMPRDNSLNTDMDDITLRHVAATTLLDQDNPKKVSLATPKQV